MSTVYRFPAEEQLATLRQWLWHEHISHYYRVQDNAQLIILINDAQQVHATALVERWRRGELSPLSSISTAGSLVRGNQWKHLRRALRHQPITTLMVVISIIVYSVFALQPYPDNLLFYQNFMVLSPEAWPNINDSLHLHIALAAVLHEHEWWRLVTPIFLHFGFIHIAFNMTWLWAFGKYIERDEGSLYWVGLVALWSIVSNLAQLFYGGPAFGGMSGVVYAIMGYLWVEQVTGRRRVPVIPGWLLFVAILWALWGVINSMGVDDHLNIIEPMANAAHFGGLLAGCASALISSLWHRLIDKRQSL